MSNNINLDMRLRYVGRRKWIILPSNVFSVKYFANRYEVITFETEEDYMKAIRYETNLIFKRVIDKEKVINDKAVKPAKILKKTKNILKKKKG